MQGNLQKDFCRVWLKDDRYHFYNSCRHDIGETERLAANKGLRLQPRLLQAHQAFAFMKYQLHAADGQGTFRYRHSGIIPQYPVVTDIRRQCRSWFYDTESLHSANIRDLIIAAKVGKGF